jgi:hypothetical protein
MLFNFNCFLFVSSAVKIMEAANFELKKDFEKNRPYSARFDAKISFLKANTGSSSAAGDFSQVFRR